MDYKKNLIKNEIDEKNKLILNVLKIDILNYLNDVILNKKHYYFNKQELIIKIELISMGIDAFNMINSISINFKFIDTEQFADYESYTIYIEYLEDIREEIKLI